MGDLVPQYVISIDKINEILTNFESFYGGSMELDAYHSQTVEECIASAVENLQYFGENDFYVLQENGISLAYDLAWVSSCAHYCGLSFVIFDNFPNAGEISRNLLGLTKLSYYSQVDENIVNNLRAYLMYIDNEYAEFRYNNSYRCIKLVILMLLYRATFHAGVMARFIIQQMAVSIGIR